MFLYGLLGHHKISTQMKSQEVYEEYVNEFNKKTLSKTTLLVVLSKKV